MQSNCQASAVGISAGGSRLLKLVLFLRLVDSFAYFTLNNIFTLHLTEVLGIGDAAAGALFGLRGGITMLFGVALGPVVDKLGVALTLPVAFILCGGGRWLFAVASTPTMAMIAVYGPMAIGHGLVGPALTIALKRATCAQALQVDINAAGTVASREQERRKESWGFALNYCAVVIGIALCGPFIDLLAITTPDGVYRRLAMITAVVAIVLAIVSAVAFCCIPGAAYAATFVSDRPPFAKRYPKQNIFKNRKAKCLHYCTQLKTVVCTKTFARYCAFSVVMLPGSSVLRNLDGGIFPKFMLRYYGPSVPKGTIYALEPTLDLVLVPTLAKLTARRSHFAVIRVGILFAALSPFAIAIGAGSRTIVQAQNAEGNYGWDADGSIAAVVIFVLILTFGDALYTARTSAYAMSIAPDGYEGTFAGLSHSAVFLADLPTGLLGGVLLAFFCPEEAKLQSNMDEDSSICDARRLFGTLGMFAILSPFFLWMCPSLFREPETPDSYCVNKYSKLHVVQTSCEGDDVKTGKIMLGP
eukprot:SAG31_NODE_2736_length_5167_cov_4.773283_3_plen_528_part_00